MWLPKPPILIQLLILFSLFQVPSLAIKKSYIVYLGSHSHGPKVSQADLDGVTQSHYNFLSSFLGSTEKAKNAIFYSYQRYINGFAANLEEEEAAEIAKNPRVVSVFLNKGRKLHTTRSWEFMLQEKNDVVVRNSLWEKSRFGTDTIIGNLDTGVWPKSESFNDKGYKPIPARWKGICQKSSVEFTCNRKLIGARYFNKGYAAFGGKLNSSFETALDHQGHGTHTLSTAGGNFVPGANVFGMGNGTAKGGSPKARVAAYKVCWPPIEGNECFDADILAGFEMAIQDGVDVLSISLGSLSADYFEDGIAIGSFHAVRNGIVVVCSAGNSGPAPGTVTNVAPWIITVGASTLDREFQAFVELPNGLRLKGMSLSGALLERKLYPLISGTEARLSSVLAEEAMLCMKGTLDPKKVKGKILVCLRGETARVDKGEQAILAGAAGMILCNDESNGDELISDPHLLPSSQITFTDGETVFKYINSTKNPQGYITPPVTKLDTKPAPFMASFSARGPNPITPEILKPDITAPGVNIIAAFSEAVSPTAQDFDKRRIPYNAESGTSMSCPHVAGVVGLLKTLYPQWSPAAIRSAILTTARTKDNTGHRMLEASLDRGTPFSYGFGHIRPNLAQDPGLIYDLSNNDYLDFLCALKYNTTMIQVFSQSKQSYECPKSASLLNFNYPSITVPNLNGCVTVTRRVKNVGNNATYVAQVNAPVGILVSVEPKVLNLTHHEEQSFNVTLKVKAKWSGYKRYVFGALTWSDGKHYVRSPIVVAQPIDN
ncbi:hypothetical protein UlMin_016513 [Ulmus minor]